MILPSSCQAARSLRYPTRRVSWASLANGVGKAHQLPSMPLVPSPAQTVAMKSSTMLRALTLHRYHLLPSFKRPQPEL